MNAQTKEIEIIEATTPARLSFAMTPMEMLDRAISQGAGIDVLTKLMDLNDRWEAGRARKAFDAAMSEAKAAMPVIGKNREVDFSSNKGRTHYRYEDLAEIMRVVTPILGKYGLSYRFRTTSVPNEPITVTCIISHRDGHFEENTLIAGRDDSGNKNSIQAIGSAVTYLQRYTLKAALGLAASNDDDGRSYGNGNGGGGEDTITPEQVMELHHLIVETAASLPKFFAMMGVPSLPELPASSYARAKEILEARKQSQEKKAPK